MLNKLQYTIDFPINVSSEYLLVLPNFKRIYYYYILNYYKNY